MSPTLVANWYVDSSGNWQRYERTQVPVENFNILNPPGAGVNATPIIQASLNAGPTYLNDGDYFCQGQIDFTSNMHLRLSAGANLWRNYSSSGATTASFLCNANLATTISNVTIDGAGNIAATTGNGGNMMGFNCDGLTVDGIRATYWTGGRYAMVVGDNHVWQNCTWRSAPGATTGAGGLRFAGGNNFLGQNLNIISGDDVFQCVPAGAATDPLFNATSTSGGIYQNCVGRSYHARVIAVGLQDSNGNGTTTLGMNVSITGLEFKNISGYGGGSAVNVANHSSTGTITNIKFDNVQIDQRLTYSATQGQCGETYVQREGSTCGNVDSIDYAGTLFPTRSGVTIYNQRSAKDLTCISAPFGGVTNVTTAHSGSGNLALDPDTLT